jgi:tryptophan synthase alpha chain
LSDRPIARAVRAARAAGRAALIPYLTAGFPTRDTSREAVRRAAERADVIEVGVPFSDPLADGPTIQRSTHIALEQGMTVGRVLELVQAAAPAAPVVVMTYLNPILSYGVDRFLVDAKAAGVAGVLLTDLPAGAAPEVESAVLASDLDLIRLVAPTTPEARLRQALAAGRAGGFVYLISRLGVTGARRDVPNDLAPQVARVRAATTLPVAVGFGIATPAQAAATAAVADGVVVGSALVEALGSGGVPALMALLDQLADAVRVSGATA